MFKNFKKWVKLIFKNETGNASIEYVLILAMIVSIIFALSSITLSIKNRFITSTCQINCSIAETKYNSYLNEIGATHSDTLLEHFIMNLGNAVCLENYTVTYINDKLQCNVHQSNENTDIDNENNSDEAVPFL